MSTPCRKVWSRFERKILDYDLMDLKTNNVLGWEEDIAGITESAVSRFLSCKVDLSLIEPDINDPTSEWEFSGDLNATEQEIVALYMIQEWLQPFVNNQDMLEKYLTTQEYHAFADSTKVANLKSLHNESIIDAEHLENKYAYLPSGLGALK